jgi:TfoX/Sxy family transcriptional regulator of competence genes
MPVTPEARARFEELLDLLEPHGEDITGKSMFGGFGFWEHGDVFALLSSQGVLYFKTDETTVARYRKARASQFMPVMSRSDEAIPMPYWSVPKAVLRDDDRLHEWVVEAIAVGHATAAPKRPKRKRS